eukprot:363235-Chlamydomonas_euryale.AAC.4
MHTHVHAPAHPAHACNLMPHVSMHPHASTHARTPCPAHPCTPMPCMPMHTHALSTFDAEPPTGSHILTRADDAAGEGAGHTQTPEPQMPPGPSGVCQHSEEWTRWASHWAAADTDAAGTGAATVGNRCGGTFKPHCSYAELGHDAPPCGGPTPELALLMPIANGVGTAEEEGPRLPPPTLPTGAPSRGEAVPQLPLLALSASRATGLRRAWPAPPPLPLPLPLLLTLPCGESPSSSMSPSRLASQSSGVRADILGQHVSVLPSAGPCCVAGDRAKCKQLLSSRNC